jgi:predicted site-specific integrase-resolvase
MKAIIIARVSTEEQKDAGNSLPAQISVLKAIVSGKALMIICI